MIKLNDKINDNTYKDIKKLFAAQEVVVSTNAIPIFLFS